MTKKQKIWLWIFIAMFALPEIFWSPISNFIFMLFQGGNSPVALRDNFLIHSDYRKLLIIVVLIQSIGALLSSFMIYKLSIKITYRIFLSILFFIFFILSTFVLYLLIATVNMSIL